MFANMLFELLLGNFNYLSTSTIVDQSRVIHGFTILNQLPPMSYDGAAIHGFTILNQLPPMSHFGATHKLCLGTAFLAIHYYMVLSLYYLNSHKTIAISLQF